METDLNAMIEMNQFLMQQIKEMQTIDIEVRPPVENQFFQPLKQRKDPRKQIVKIGRALQQSFK